MDEQELNPDYLKGFNQGYLLAKHDPELAERLSKAMPDTQRGNGFKGGLSELKKEKEKGILPPWLQQDRLASIKSFDQNKMKDTDRDIDK